MKYYIVGYLGILILIFSIIGIKKLGWKQFFKNFF